MTEVLRICSVSGGKDSSALYERIFFRDMETGFTKDHERT